MEDALGLTLLGAYVAFLLLDLVISARPFVPVRGWRVRALGVSIVSLALFITLPFVWDATLSQYRIFDLTGLPTALGAIVGLLALQFVSYWWHRALHRVPLLWRWFHQMHHSAERIDIYGAFYFHPLDAIGFAFVSSFALCLVVGVTPEATLVASTLSTFAAYFGHANIRTPQWLGYIIQRPENHASHHQRGVHAFNYGDVPIWDMIFGTFRNPRTFDAEAGYYDGASQRVGEMLMGRDVSTPVTASTQVTSTSPAEPARASA